MPDVSLIISAPGRYWKNVVFNCPGKIMVLPTLVEKKLKSLFLYCMRIRFKLKYGILKV